MVSKFHNKMDDHIQTAKVRNVSVCMCTVVSARACICVCACVYVRVCVRTCELV